MCSPTQFQQAFELHQAGELALARELYCQLVQQEPAHADAWHLLGMIAYQTEDHALAQALIEHALQLHPKHPEYLNHLGLVLRARGDLSGAEAMHRLALVQQPDHVEALNNLGVALLEQHRPGEARTLFERAVALAPEHLLARMNLGNVFLELEQAHDARAAYEAVLAQCPDHALALNNLGNALKRLGDFAGAERTYRKASALRPDLLDARNNLSGVLCKLGRHSEALAILRALLAHRPDHPGCHFNVGCVLQEMGHLEEATQFYRDAIRRDAGHARAYNNLGLVLALQGKTRESIDSLRAATRADPNYADAASNYLFQLLFDTEADPQTVLEEHRQCGTRWEAQAPPPVPHRNTPEADRPLRIGYVSPDLRNHAVMRFLEPVLREHDKREYAVTCYAEIGQPDATSERVRQYVSGWRSTCGRSDAEVAAQIRADGMDILVDLAGHTAGNRLRMFTHRPAPVQVTWLGYPNTTGLRCIEYLLTDKAHYPSGMEQYCTEEVVYLPGGLCCFAAPENAPAVTPLPALGRGTLTFGSLHNLGKLNAAVLDLWARLLHALPGSRLLVYRDNLTGSLREQLHQKFWQRGLGADRVELRSGTLPGGYLSVYGDVDISLDVFPYGGGTTVFESLWMGVPMLTLGGSTCATRGAAGALPRVGLQEFVTWSAEDFVARGVRVAAEIDYLAAIRQGLRSRMLATLGDASAFTRTLEATYRELWQRWCARQPRAAA